MIKIKTTILSDGKTKGYRFEKVFGDSCMWRESEEEAIADLQRKFYDWCDVAKGLSELNKIEDFKKKYKNYL